MAAKRKTKTRIYTFCDVRIETTIDAIDVEAATCTEAYRKLRRMSLRDLASLGHITMDGLEACTDSAFSGDDEREFADMEGYGPWRRIA